MLYVCLFVLTFLFLCCHQVTQSKSVPTGQTSSATRSTLDIPPTHTHSSAGIDTKAQTATAHLTQATTPPPQTAAPSSSLFAPLASKQPATTNTTAHTTLSHVVAPSLFSKDATTASQFLFFSLSYSTWYAVFSISALESKGDGVYIYIYIYMCVCVCVCVWLLLLVGF